MAILDKVSVCLGAIAKLEARLEARPIPPGPTAILLGAPACSFGCRPCHMECAIAPERLAWWEGELARQGGVRRTALKRDGMDHV